MENVQIRYYNVIFGLQLVSEMDQMAFDYFAERIRKGELMKMKQIVSWCNVHEVTYNYKFVYRWDFPLKANIWNLYSYCRFKVEQCIESGGKHK